MSGRIRADVAAVQGHDPAARSFVEIVLTYPGLHAVWAHRLANRLWASGLAFPARLVSAAARLLTGVDIHPAATIGERFFIDHATGVVIGGVVVAPIASELILPIAVAVTNRITVNELAQTLAVYPSLSGTITEAARRLMAHDDLD